jgi:glycosyltransferase involved in cell wall biosynthesis
VGTIQARKNVDLLVQAMRSLRRSGLPHRVVLAGRRGWLAAPAFREIEADDTASWLGAVPGADLPALYAMADAFVSPSAYEGFGFTVADALAAGTPTVISPISSLPELCGDAAVRIEELTAEGVAAALGPLLQDQERRRTLADQGRRRAAEFSWRRAAQETLAVYQEARGDY